MHKMDPGSGQGDWPLIGPYIRLMVPSPLLARRWDDLRAARARSIYAASPTSVHSSELASKANFAGNDSAINRHTG